jgi:hypothetical protein
MSGKLHAPVALAPGKLSTGTQWIGGSVGPGAGMDTVEKRKILPLPVIEPRPFSPQSITTNAGQKIYIGTHSHL